MSLSQALMDEVAREALRAQGELAEEVTYTHKATANAVATVVRVPMLFGNYRTQDITMELILPNDMRGFLATAAVAFAPTRFDQFTRPNGMEWRVMSVAGGPGTPFWVLQCRQVA